MEDARLGVASLLMQSAMCSHGSYLTLKPHSFPIERAAGMIDADTLGLVSRPLLHEAVAARFPQLRLGQSGDPTLWFSIFEASESAGASTCCPVLE